MSRFRCPRCQGELKTVEKDDVTVEVCLQCAGIYLDRGELDKLAASTAGSVEYCSATSAETVENDRARIQCVKCSSEFMSRIQFLTLTDIFLDRCDACGGFWLDQGELARINERIEQTQDTNWSESLLFWQKLQIMVSQVSMSLGV